MAKPKMLHRVIVYTLGTIFLLMFSSYLVSYEYLRAYAPRQPDPASGQIYPMEMQQPFNVYLTGPEVDWVDDGPVVAMVFGFAAGCLRLWWKFPRNPLNDLPKKLY